MTKIQFKIWYRFENFKMKYVYSIDICYFSQREIGIQESKTYKFLIIVF